LSWIFDGFEKIPPQKDNQGKQGASMAEKIKIEKMLSIEYAEQFFCHTKMGR